MIMHSWREKSIPSTREVFLDSRVCVCVGGEQYARVIVYLFLLLAAVDKMQRAGR